MIFDSGKRVPAARPIVERLTRNFGDKRLTGAVFLNVAKAFDIVRIDGNLYKLMFLNFLPYIVHTMPSYLRSRKFEASFQMATSCRRGIRAGVVQGGFIPLFSSVICLTTEEKTWEKLSGIRKELGSSVGTRFA